MSSHAKIFTSLYEPLVYHAPGSAASTRRALDAIGELPNAPRVLDIGCGPGRQTLQLARTIDGHVVAVDTSRNALARLSERRLAEQTRLHVSVLRASMTQLCFPDETFDLVWSEGAIYCMGFAAGLGAWRRLLKVGGFLAVTELTWLSDKPPEDTLNYWSANYPAMRTTARNRDAIERAGYELVDEFALPESDWWDDYYAELAKRITTFAQQFEGADREVALAVTKQSETEIETLRHSHGSYGYVFYIMRKPN